MVTLTSWVLENLWWTVCGGITCTKTLRLIGAQLDLDLMYIKASLWHQCPPRVGTSFSLRRLSVGTSKDKPAQTVTGPDSITSPDSFTPVTVSLSVQCSQLGDYVSDSLVKTRWRSWCRSLTVLLLILLIQGQDTDSAAELWTFYSPVQLPWCLLDVETVVKEASCDCDLWLTVTWSNCKHSCTSWYQ